MISICGPSIARSWSIATTLKISRRGDREHLLARVEGDRQHAVAAREILRHELQRFRIGDHLGEVDRLLADGARHDVADGALGDEPEPHQQAADGDVVVALLGERDGELIGGDQPLLHQQLAQPQFFPLFRPWIEGPRREPAMDPDSKTEGNLSRRIPGRLFYLRGEPADALLGLRDVEVGAARWRRQAATARR